MSTELTRPRGTHSQEENDLRLYSTEYCFYCRRVAREANKLGIALRVIDIFSDHAARERLLAATGRTRVPVLGIVDEKGQETFLPESDDIIFFLRTRVKGDVDPPP